MMNEDNRGWAGEFLLISENFLVIKNDNHCKRGALLRMRDHRSYAGSRSNTLGFFFFHFYSTSGFGVLTPLRHTLDRLDICHLNARKSPAAQSGFWIESKYSSVCDLFISVISRMAFFHVTGGQFSLFLGLMQIGIMMGPCGRVPSCLRILRA